MADVKAIGVSESEYLRLCAQYNLVRLAHQVIDMSDTELNELNALLSIAHARPWYHAPGTAEWGESCANYEVMSSESFTEAFEGVAELFAIVSLTTPAGRREVVDTLSAINSTATSVFPEVADGSQ